MGTETKKEPHDTKLNIVTRLCKHGYKTKTLSFFPDYTTLIVTNHL